MAIKKIKMIVAIALTGLFAGCAKEPPKCSDEATFSIVRNLFLKQIESPEVTRKEIQENLKFELPRATAFDEKIKKYSCAAKLNIGGTYQLPITYESQLDDKNEHIAGLGNIATSDLYASKMSFIAGVKKSRIVQEEIAPVPQESANVTTTPEPAPVTAAPQAKPQPKNSVLGRCHMDSCWWWAVENVESIQSEDKGELFKVAVKTTSEDYSNSDVEKKGYPASPSETAQWDETKNVFVLCSKKLPAYIGYDDEQQNYTGTLLGSSSGATEGIENLYSHICKSPIDSNSESSEITLKKPEDIFNYGQPASHESPASTSYAEPKSFTGKCLLEVNKIKYLKGQCSISMDRDGSLNIGSSDPEELTYFALVNVTSKNVADGYWNEEKGANHAHSPLGQLERKGACWENKNAKVCAWK